MMEYYSIPWAEHRQDEGNSYRKLTVNLALWWVHVLAGNQYKAEWVYDELGTEAAVERQGLTPPDTGSSSPGQETTVSETSESDAELSESTAENEEVHTPSNKRKWGEGDAPDDPNFSFSSNKRFDAGLGPESESDSD